MTATDPITLTWTHGPNTKPLILQFLLQTLILPIMFWQSTTVYGNLQVSCLPHICRMNSPTQSVQDRVPSTLQQTFSIGSLVGPSGPSDLQFEESIVGPGKSVYNLRIDVGWTGEYPEILLFMFP